MSFPTPSASSYFYKLVPFSSKALPALNGTTEVDANAAFNTNIPFGLAMVIRRVHHKWWMSTVDNTNNGVELLVAQLTEASGATKPTAGDPLALWTDISKYTINVKTAAGYTTEWDPGFVRTEYPIGLHPGVPTLAQQLNVVLSGNNVDSVHTAVPVWVFFMEIYYELVQLNQQLKDYLANRISLQRTS